MSSQRADPAYAGWGVLEGFSAKMLLMLTLGRGVGVKGDPRAYIK